MCRGCCGIGYKRRQPSYSTGPTEVGLSDRARSIIAQAQQDVVNRGNPKLSSLPEWVEEFREHQVTAVKQIVEGYQSGCRMVVLDAPTGSGKTLIAETVRRLLGVKRTVYSCSTRSLQQQFGNDYPYAKVLMGRNNYPTERYPGRFTGNTWSSLSCSDCHKEPGDERSCRWCTSTRNCPYEIAKREALRSDLAILNGYYWLTEANGPGRWSGVDFGILDECDTLESELMRYVAVDISDKRARSLALDPPDRVTKPDSWVAWFEKALPLVKAARDELGGATELRDIRNRKYLVSLYSNMVRVAGGIEDGWVYTGKDGRISFKPVRVNEIGGKYLWGHGGKWLLMSASVLSAGQLLDELGWEQDYHVVSIPSTFSPQNRTVHIQPTANMSRKHNELGKLVGTLREIIKRHSTERMLLHCVSYDLARQLHGELSGSCKEIGVGCGTYTGADERTGALDKFRASGRSGDRGSNRNDNKGYVLIAPSLDRGVDLPDEQCRVQLICKVPYPYLGDRQVSARLHSQGGQVWYNVQTVRSIVQMSGRGVRHKDDWCKTYILDSQFLDLWNKARGLFPKWYVEAIEWSR